MEMSSVSAPITKYLMSKSLTQKIKHSCIYEKKPLLNMK